MAEQKYDMVVEVFPVEVFPGAIWVTTDLDTSRVKGLFVSYRAHTTTTIYNIDPRYDLDGIIADLRALVEDPNRFLLIDNRKKSAGAVPSAIIGEVSGGQ